MGIFTQIKPNMPQHEAVYNQLRAAIVEGALVPGEKLVEKNYAEIFNVSRTPVREALHMLEQAGLVVYVPQKGCFVRPLPDIDEVEEVYDIRCALEVMSADALIENCTPANIKAFEKYNDKCQKAIEKGDLSAYLRYLAAFHELQLAIYKKPLLGKVLNMIETYQPDSSFEDDQSSKIKVLTYTKDRQIANLNEHIQFVDAIKAKDVNRLKDVIRVHLENSKIANVEAYMEFQAIIASNKL